MWNFKIGQAFVLMLHTMPFIGLRCAVYFGITLAYVLSTGLGAGIGWGIGTLGTSSFQSSAAAWGGFLGFALVSAVAYFMRSYILYMVKTAHIAVLVELLHGNSLPDGRGQIAHGRAVVTERFGQANLLFGLDLLIKGVIRSITGLIQGLLSFVPGSERAMGLVDTFLKVSVGLMDEVILAHAIYSRSENAWASAKDALVLYGQNAKPILKNALWLTVLSYGLTIVAFVFSLAPAAALSWFFPGGLSALAVLLAIVFAWALKAALLDPLILTCLLQVYFKAIEGQEPQQEWQARLESASGKFRELKDKALMPTKG